MGKKKSGKLGLLLGIAGALGVGAYLWGDGLRFANEYEQKNGVPRADGHPLQTITLPKRNKIRYLDPTEAAVLSNGLLYFGQPSCPYCRNAAPVLLQLAAQRGITVSYVATETWRDTYVLKDGQPVRESAGGPGYEACLYRYADYLQDYTLEGEDGQQVPVGEKRIYVPLLVRIVNGKVVGTWSTDSVDPSLLPQDKYELWNDDQRAAVMQSMAAHLGL